LIRKVATKIASVYLRIVQIDIRCKAPPWRYFVKRSNFKAISLGTIGINIRRNKYRIIESRIGVLIPILIPGNKVSTFPIISGSDKIISVPHIQIVREFKQIGKLRN
jgi:hypothetical protein